MTIQQAISDALAAAAAAAAKTIAENPGVWYPCGFATVRIKPARGKLVQALKDAHIGTLSTEGGYIVMNPSRNATQWMDAKAAGARAFQETLTAWLAANPKDAGTTKITVETMMD